MKKKHGSMILKKNKEIKQINIVVNIGIFKNGPVAY